MGGVYTPQLSALKAIDGFIMFLHTLAKLCKSSSFKDDLLKNCLVVGLSYDELSQIPIEHIGPLLNITSAKGNYK